MAAAASTDAMAPAWCADNESTDYTIQNLPYGIFSTPGKAPRCGVAIGDNVVGTSRHAQTRRCDHLRGDIHHEKYRQIT